MPADTDPASARINDDLVIDVERDNGGPTNSRQPYQTYSCCVPSKVVSPCVLTGMKYGHQFAAKRLMYSGGWPFEFTPTTGKTKVGKRARAALCFGEDVVYNHWLAGIGFGCLTIDATVVVCFRMVALSR